MEKRTSSQTVTQDVAGAYAQVLAQLETVTSTLADIQKGQYGTVVRGTHVGQDINADEAMRHASAMIPLNAKAWFDQCMWQVTVSNNMLLQQQAGLNEIALEKARGHSDKKK